MLKLLSPNMLIALRGVSLSANQARVSEPERCPNMAASNIM